MKKIIFGLITTILFISCENESNSSDNSLNSEEFPLQTNKIADTENALKKINNFKIKNFGSTSNFDSSTNKSKLTFDYNNLTSVKIDNQNKSALIANQVNYDVNNPENKSIAFFMNDKKEIVNSLIIENKIISENNREVSYYTVNNEILMTIKFDKAKNSSEFVFHNKNLKNAKKKPCSEETLDCIEDFYTGHGWLSVAIWVGSAFGPEVPVAIAIACAASYCLIY